MPTTAVDNLDTRMMSKWRPISIKTLQQCMETLAKNLRAAINMKTGKSFGLMFDGWSYGSMHFVGLYSVYEVVGIRCERLLSLSLSLSLSLARSLSPLGSQTAEAYITMIR
ncbi:hypothetical protein L914_02128 [Phytophthora nicotianae]|uniref:Uncharacterized protein n=1 Tax=Phytophthora nicotianae TaxID=4792 RepID=W2P0N3_PHYNI|nr:hypothetical protein L914_02128 [Phytophthora nicotianae]